MGTKGRILGAAGLAAMLAVAAACGGDNKTSGSTTTATATATTTASTAAATTALAPTTAATTTAVAPTTAATTAPATTAPGTRYYLSLGDSYASGYQPGVGNTTAGFAYQVAAASTGSAHPLELVNVGCAGATTSSLLNSKGCPAPALGPGAAPYDDQTQLEAAEAFLQQHPGAVDLVTVSIGGNDVTACAKDPNNVAGCVGTAVSTINANLPMIVQRLRAAAGPDTVILGTTYPDVILGDWVTGATNGQQLATLSVAAFQSLINPALANAYAGAQGQFIDVTAATGAYGPLTELTDLPPYGSIPVPVAKVCELTHFCEQEDIHPNEGGYKVIADLVYAAFVKAQGGS
jgi:lysophospholipase L1-like esterase